MKLSGFRRKKESKDSSYKGFTLLECLVSLVIIALVIHSFSWFLQIEKKLIPQSKGASSSLEWHLFATNLDNTSQNWCVIKVENDTIWFKEESEREETSLFFIEYVNHQLRKRKNTGVELLLDNVETVSYGVNEAEVRMDVMFTDGRRFQGIFSHWLKN